MADIETSNITATGNWDLTGGDVKVPAPSVDTDASTKKYVDDNAGGAPEGTAVLSTGEGGAVKYLREDGDGTCSWQTPAGSGDMTKAVYDTDDDGIVDAGGSIKNYGRKGSAGTITKGSPIYLSGWNASGFPEFEEADADDAAKMPAIAIAAEDMTNAADALVINTGQLTAMDTSAWSVGDVMYVHTTAGELTNVKPTGTAQIQKIGEVVRDHATLGVMVVFGAGRSNDVPNITENFIWLGNGSGVATPINFDDEVSLNGHVVANTAASHAESHTVVSHSDTTATGAELNTLTGGGDTTLHDHDGISENTTHRSSDGTDHANVVLNDAHRADNTQAHSDYLLNSGADVAVGPLTTTADNSTADQAYVPMVLYNTDATPPAASGFPVGTIYIQYTA